MCFSRNNVPATKGNPQTSLWDRQWCHQSLTRRMVGFLSIRITRLTAAAIIHVIIIVMMYLFGPEGHFSREQLWTIVLWTCSHSQFVSELSCICFTGGKQSTLKTSQGHEETCKLITEKTRGLIRNWCRRTKWVLKYVQVAALGKVGIYKNKSDRRMCAPVGKLWPMQTNILETVDKWWHRWRGLKPGFILIFVMHLPNYD